MRTIVFLLLAVCYAGATQAQIPHDASRYRRDLIRAAHQQWGLGAPISTFAGQIHQESAWDFRAKSPYASGLAQFTPGTADFMGRRFPELGPPDVWNPVWSMRAMVALDFYLWEMVDAAEDCERMAFALSGYNGGFGWTRKDIALAGKSGADPLRWFGHVERFNAGRAPWAFQENRGYPRAILKRWEPVYERAGWGGGLCD